MPGRLVSLVNGEYYHVFNRGADKRDLFIQLRDYKRFKQTFCYYQFAGPKPKFSNFSKARLASFKPIVDSKLVEIICFCLMPNHFHFLVRQLKEDGVSKFISQITNSYTKFFNTKYGRVGALLQGKFKAVLVETDEQLIHLSRYIHLNPIVSGFSKSPDYPWSSYHEYLKGREICQTEPIMSFFSSSRKYKEFLEDHIDYASSIEVMKHQIIDDI